MKQKSIEETSIDNDIQEQKATNTKVIMAKQFFETMNHNNVPRQHLSTKTPEPQIENCKNIINNAKNALAQC